jgi:AcrR family transcriptional regulator
MEAGDRPRRGAPPKGEVTARERILATASKLFYRDGIRVIGVDTVVERSGVSKTSLHRLFDSKDALIAAFAAEKDQCGAAALRERGFVGAQMRQTDVLGHVDMDEAAASLARPKPPRSRMVAGLHVTAPARIAAVDAQGSGIVFAPRQQRLHAPRRRPQSPSLMLKRGLPIVMLRTKPTRNARKVAET